MGDRGGDPRGLLRVERERLPGVDLAEAARAGAPVAEDHERRGAVGPALVDVRARGLFAHRVQVEIAHQPLRGPEPATQVGPHPHPLRSPGVGLDPLRDSRLGQAPEQAHRSAPASRLARERGEVVGVFAPHDVLAFHDPVGEVRGELGDHGVDERTHLRGGSEHARQRRDTPIGDTARDDVLEHPEIGIDVERESVTGAAARDLHPDRGDLLVTDPDARVTRLALGRDAEVGERVDEHTFECPHVRHDVAQSVAPVGEGDDRVADQLPGTVIRDVAAAIRTHEVGTDVRRRHQHVGRIGRGAEGEHVRVFEEQQVVVVGAPVERALELVGFAVRNATEPPRPEHQSSSASQSRVSSSVCIARRNAAA